MNSVFDYKYELDGKVTTPFGAPGIIEMLGYDDGGRKYYVQSAGNSAWFKEIQLQSGADDVLEYNPLGMFVSSNVIEPCVGECVLFSDVYDRYLEFTDDKGIRPISKSAFRQTLAEHGFEAEKKAGRLVFEETSFSKSPF
ncbi:MAG: winged helix-turn-helix domain-containing protein [Desulfotalea sp.]